MKSLKSHLRKVVGETKLTFEEATTLLAQIEAILNSRPLVPLSHDDDCIEAITPGHFLIGRSLEAIPDPQASYKPMTVLRRWHLVQALVRHFRKRWSVEYLTTIRKYSKWHHKTRNLEVGDIVLMQEDNLFTTKWPLAKVIRVYEGRDGVVRVALVKTSRGSYNRPVNKLALLLPHTQ